jgi:hypothetical protein
MTGKQKWTLWCVMWFEQTAAKYNTPFPLKFTVYSQKGNVRSDCGVDNEFRTNNQREDNNCNLGHFPISTFKFRRPRFSNSAEN